VAPRQVISIWNPIQLWASVAPSSLHQGHRVRINQGEKYITANNIKTNAEVQLGKQNEFA
jgi:hypothetical protein